MKKIIHLVFLCLFLLPALGHAASKELSLNAGGSSITGEFNVKYDTDFGYIKPGVSAFYYSKDDQDFTIIDGKIVVGSETLYPGLVCELGFKGFLGSVNKGSRDGDLGGIGFFGLASYTLSERISPIPIEFLGSLTYAPELLSFIDLEKYWDLRLGIAIHIVEQAAIVVDYRHFSIHMDEDPGKWKLDEGAFNFGIEISW